MRDPRGRTPLLLAVTLGHIETVRVLLDAGADVNCEKDGWTGKEIKYKAVFKQKKNYSM